MSLLGRKFSTEIMEEKMKIELNRILLCGVFATIASSAFAEENPIDWTGSYVGLFAGTYNANTKLTTVESNRSA